MMELDIDCESWASEAQPAELWKTLSHAAASAAALVETALANTRLSASALFTSDADIHALNHRWRGRDRPTNILSFPMLSGEQISTLDPQGPPILLGDIALAHETCIREAEGKGIPLNQHVAHLVIHGLLHLAGHDHVDSDAQAAAMEALEIKALAHMGIADPYGDRDI